jgi:hypothetical protein
VTGSSVDVDAMTTPPPYEVHECFREPRDRDIPVWRYMDLAKYVDLLQRRQLFFSRADLLGDPFEGSVTRVNIMVRRAASRRLDLQRQANPSPVPRLIAAAKSMHEQIAEANRSSRRTTYINCWHMNEHESAAMWKLYAASDSAVAVRSTFAKLRGCLPTGGSHQPLVYLGEVTYIDYEHGATRAAAPSSSARRRFPCPSSSRLLGYTPGPGAPREPCSRSPSCAGVGTTVRAELPVRPGSPLAGTARPPGSRSPLSRGPEEEQRGLGPGESPEEELGVVAAVQAPTRTATSARVIQNSFGTRRGYPASPPSRAWPRRTVSPVRSGGSPRCRRRSVRPAARVRARPSA